ncbi:MAG: hypothetical protein H0T42_09475 [Deltaproteobacteria bacterium]|nr:hypothetical protein [Deltaproteobacteria bacterium]
MKKLLLAVVMVSMGCSGPEAKVEKMSALDRIWIDHLPKTESDTIHVFAAITEEPMGIFQATSTWKGQYELFIYEAHGDTIRAVYPQDKSREELKVSARTCSDVRDMDYCLEIKGASRGPKKYYSRKGWEIDAATSADDVALRGKAIVKQLAAE